MSRPTSTRRAIEATVYVCLVMVLIGPASSPGFAEDTPEAAPDSRFRGQESALREEIKKYSELVQALRESLAVADSSGDQRGQRILEIEGSASELGEAIGGIAEQLAEIEFEIGDNQFSLSDGRGGRVTVDIPENLGERLNEGLSTITRSILEDMPDTLFVGNRETGLTWDWSDGRLQVGRAAPPRQRRVIEGGLVKIKDDLRIAADEDVMGDAVVIMGDVLVEGRVRGDLVAILGDVQLGEDAAVDGQVVSILGNLDRDAGADIGSVTVIGAGQGLLPLEFARIGGGWSAFWSFQALFLMLLFLVVLLLAFTPRARLESLVATMQQRPGECVGLGLLLALIGHIVVLGLGAILVLTVIGIPVALLLLVAVGLLDLAAVGVASLAVGRRLCARFGLECPRPWRETILGMVVLHLPALLAAGLAAVSAPLAIVLLLTWTGRLVKFVAFCYGLGALILGRFGSRRSRATVPLPAPPLPEPPLA